MTACETEVVKVGGSLLTRPSFAASLREWLARASLTQVPIHRVLVVGGGTLVKALRQTVAINPIDEHVAHWHAIECMEINTAIVRHWLPEIGEARTIDQLRENGTEGGATLFRPLGFLRVDEPYRPGVKLPVGWHTTSDSIAARLAICLGSQRLRLLKSRPPVAAEAADWSHAAAGGMVDEFFPQLTSYIQYITLETLDQEADEPFAENAKNPADY